MFQEVNDTEIAAFREPRKNQEWLAAAWSGRFNAIGDRNDHFFSRDGNL